METRTRHVRRAAAGILAVSALVALGCGGGGAKTVDTSVDTAAVEQGIQKQLAVTGSDVQTVSCPSYVKTEVGATFKCDVTLTNGATGKVEVTQSSASQYQYALVPGSVQVPGATVEQSVEQQLAKSGAPNASVNCPDNIIVKVGTYVTCDVAASSGQAAGTVTFTFSDPSGTVDTTSVKTAA